MYVNSISTAALRLLRFVIDIWAEEWFHSAEWCTFLLNYTPAAGFKLHRGFVLLADRRCAIFIGPISFASDPEAVSKIYCSQNRRQWNKKKFLLFSKKELENITPIADAREREKENGAGVAPLYSALKSRERSSTFLSAKFTTHQMFPR